MHIVPLGGLPPYGYHWSVYSPAGEQANNLLDSTDGSAARFTAGEIDGPYDVRCAVTDARGRQYTASLVLHVGGAIGLDVATERLGVLAGGGALGQVTIRLDPQAGTAPFEVSWVCTGPDGKIDNDRLDTTDPLRPRFTSADEVGTYVLTATIEDANGVVSVESVIVVVGEMLGVDVVAGRASVLPGGGPAGMTRLLATPIGGTAPYQYDWEVIGPDGEPRSGLLWDTETRSPIFESADRTGTYLARCAVTDANGTVLMGSTTVAVGQQISVDVTADRLALPTGGAAGAQATLTADIRGGSAPPTIAWRVIGPDGQDSTVLLSTSHGTETVFSAGDQPGSYIVRCTATDADAVSATDSLVLTVGGTLGVAVVAEKTSLATGGSPPTCTATLSVQAYGGLPPYRYNWSVINPDGEPEPARLDDATIQDPTFTSSSRVGSYSVVCKVTDAAGVMSADAVSLHVGQPLNVDVTVDKQALVAGGGVSGQAQLITTVNGGASPYAFQWSVIGPDNTPSPSRLSGTQIANPVFTTELVTGTYRLTLTTTDAVGVVFVDSVAVVVSADEVQSLSADVSIDRSPLPPYGAIATLTATTVGGTPPIAYAWTVTDPGGATDNSRLDSTSSPTVTFTSTVTQGTYRVRCTVTDAESNEFTDSVQLTVSDAFLLDLTAALARLAPGTTVSLFADRTGGAADFVYTWSCVDEAGAPAGTFTVGPTGPGAASQTAADDVTNAWTAPAAGTGSSGTYRVQITAMDAQGHTAVDSVQLVVQAPLSLNVTASDTFVAPSTVVTLLADQSGGETPYDYAWQAADRTGAEAGTFSTGAGPVGTATQNGEAGDATNGWSIATEGAYTLTCTVTDSAGQVFTDSVPVVVTTEQAFSLDVTTDSLVAAPGETINLVGDQTGGAANFDYAWSALDESGAPGGTFGAASQTGIPDDTANTWTAPSGAGVEGTYRISCTVTDARNRTSTDSVLLEVGTLVMQNTFVAPAAADTTSVHAETNLTLAAQGAAPGQQLAAGLSNPVYPRHVIITITDANNSITGGTALVTGLDARGVAQSEIIAIAASSGGTSTNTGVRPFATVTRIDLYDFSGVTTFPPPLDTVKVGVGNKFGLTGVLGSVADVLYVNEDGTVLTSGYTVDAADGQQGITFQTPPNGARDYVVVFRVR